MARGRRDSTWEPLAWQLAGFLNGQGAKITNHRELLPFRLSWMEPKPEPVIRARSLDEMTDDELDGIFGG